MHFQNFTVNFHTSVSLYYKKAFSRRGNSMTYFFFLKNKNKSSLKEKQRKTLPWCNTHLLLLVSSPSVSANIVNWAAYALELCESKAPTSYSFELNEQLTEK